MEAATKDVTAVFHLGAILSHYCDKMPELMFDVNVKGTWNLKQACAHNRVKRIFYSSTSYVYGNPTQNPINETCPLNPKDIYGVSKLAAEKILQATYPYEVPYTILRLFNVYGPRSYPDQYYSQAITTFVLTALQGKSIEIHDDGKQKLDFIYVKDAAEAFYDCMNQKTENQIFNVGSGNSVSVNKVASSINQLTGNSEASHYNVEHIAYFQNVEANVSKIRKWVGWTPKFNLEKGLKETVEFFRNNPLE